MLEKQLGQGTAFLGINMRVSDASGHHGYLATRLSVNSLSGLIFANRLGVCSSGNARFCWLWLEFG